MGTIGRFHNLTVAEILNQMKQKGLLLLSFMVIGGIAGALGFSYMQPIYEASTLVRMAKIGGEAIETPEMLETRLKFPEAYSDGVIEVCGGAQEPNLSRYIEDAIKIKESKGDKSVAVIKASMKTKMGAENCVKQIVSMIGAQQEAMVGKELKIKQLQLEKLRQAQLEEVKRAGMQGDIGAFQFLAKENRMAALHARILDLEDAILLIRNKLTEQLTPIHIDLAPNSPRYLKTILLGGMAGLMLGMLLVIFVAGRKIGGAE